MNEKNISMKNSIPAVPDNLLNLIGFLADIVEIEGFENIYDITDPFVGRFTEILQDDFHDDNYTEAYESFQTDYNELGEIMNNVMCIMEEWCDVCDNRITFNYSTFTNFKFCGWNSEKYFKDATMMLHEISMFSKAKGFKPYDTWKESYTKFMDTIPFAYGEVTDFETAEIDHYNHMYTLLLFIVVGTIDTELKSQISHLEEEMGLKKGDENIPNSESYFKSVGCQYIFALKCLDEGDIQDKLLGITDDITKSILLLNRWYIDVLIAISKENINEMRDVEKKLYKIYKKYMKNIFIYE